MIVIPMAGLSSRFFDAGYSLPKYMLKAKGITLFEHSVLSFKEYFDSELFVFVVSNKFNTKNFVSTCSGSMGIKNVQIIELDANTRGQAETVAIGIERLANISIDEPLIIFNIDTFRPGFTIPNFCCKFDGYLEVFIGEGCNWSYVKPSELDRQLVAMTTEKDPVSDLCSTGLYYFSKVRYFIEAYNDYIKKPFSTWACKEVYVAPLYNYLISSGKKVTYNIINREQVIFCGTPDEYIEFIKG